MTVQECYEQIKGDYSGVLQRLMDDARIRKFLLRFPDEKLYEQLEEALKKEDYEEAFRGAHSIKGVCMNLGLTVLQNSSSELCNALRGGERPENLEELFEEVKKDYRSTLEAIGQL